MPPLQKQEKGAIRVLHHQGQHRLGLPRHKEQIGVNAQRGALPQDGGVQAGVAGKLFLADPQVQRPGDVEALFPLCLPDEPGALGAAVVAQVHPKGGDVVVVGVGHHVLHQGVVGALRVLQHPLGVGNQPGLKAPRGELSPASTRFRASRSGDSCIAFSVRRMVDSTSTRVMSLFMVVGCHTFRACPRGQKVPGRFL